MGEKDEAEVAQMQTGLRAPEKQPSSAPRNDKGTLVAGVGQCLAAILFPKGIW